MSSLPKTYKAASVSGANEPFNVIELPMRAVRPDEVLIKVYASGVCFGDHAVQVGALCKAFPRVAGHEVVGRIAAVGSEIIARSAPNDPRATVGALVGVGWNGGYCALFCDECREGRYEWCSTEKITGATHDGGHAEYIFAPFSSVLSIAEEALETHTYAELAPIMCAGATMYETLRTTKWSPGDVLVIQGLGGLGHLGVQYGRKLGLKSPQVVAVSSGPAKARFAKQLGADLYIDASSTDAVQTIRSLGGAKLIIATAPSAPAMISLLPALSKEGILAQVGVDFSPAGHKMEVANPLLINNRATVMGWTCGASKATENCVRFSVMAGIKPIVETFPLAKFPEAYDKLLHGSPNLRCVITFE